MSLHTQGAELMRQFIPHSPFAQHLGLALESIEDDAAEVVLPWAEHLATMGDVVHGGAIGTLVDVTAMATAWSAAEVPESLRGVTVSLTVDFVDTARAEDVRAQGRVVRRGRTLVCVDVEARAAGDDRVVAKGLVTYKVG